MPSSRNYIYILPLATVCILRPYDIAVRKMGCSVSLEYYFPLLEKDYIDGPVHNYLV